MAKSLVPWSWWTVFEVAGYIMVTVGSVLMSRWKPDKVGSWISFNWAAVITFAGLLLVVLTIMRAFAGLGHLPN